MEKQVQRMFSKELEQFHCSILLDEVKEKVRKLKAYGVDEADILKTDGDYIYSISENKVIITNVKNPKTPKIESTIYNENTIPTDLLLYKNKLVIISTKINNTTNKKDYYKGSGTILRNKLAKHGHEYFEKYILYIFYIVLHLNQLYLECYLYYFLCHYLMFDICIT